MPRLQAQSRRADLSRSPGAESAWESPLTCQLSGGVTPGEGQRAPGSNQSDCGAPVLDGASLQGKAEAPSIPCTRQRPPAASWPTAQLGRVPSPLRAPALMPAPSPSWDAQARPMRPPHTWSPAQRPHPSLCRLPPPQHLQGLPAHPPPSSLLSISAGLVPPRGTNRPLAGRQLRSGYPDTTAQPAGGGGLRWAPLGPGAAGRGLNHPGGEQLSLHLQHLLH